MRQPHNGESIGNYPFQGQNESRPRGSVRNGCFPPIADARLSREYIGALYDHDWRNSRTLAGKAVQTSGGIVLRWSIAGRAVIGMNDP